MEDIPGMAVVHYEETTRPGPVRDQRQQGLQILLRRALPDHDVHAPLQLFLRLRQRN